MGWHKPLISQEAETSGSEFKASLVRISGRPGLLPCFEKQNQFSWDTKKLSPSCIHLVVNLSLFHLQLLWYPGELPLHISLAYWNIHRCIFDSLFVISVTTGEFDSLVDFLILNRHFKKNLSYIDVVADDTSRQLHRRYTPFWRMSTMVQSNNPSTWEVEADEFVQCHPQLRSK